MTLDDLLSELRDNVLHDRSSQIDGDSDKLWSDTTLIRYLNEAQRRFARKTCCIVDKTSSVTQLLTVAYQEQYTLDPSIIAVRSVRFLGNAQWVNGVLVPGVYTPAVPATATAPVQPIAWTANALIPTIIRDDADLGRGGHTQFDGFSHIGQGYYNPRGFTELQPGKPLAFSTGEEFGADSSGSSGVVSLRLYPLASAAYAGCLVQLRVCRMPLNPLTPQNVDAVPEIPELYHLCLVDYAASRALAIVDHELGDPQRAAEFGQKFEAEVEEARQDGLRKAFVPLQWGFGRSGFSYPGN